MFFYILPHPTITSSELRVHRAGDRTRSFLGAAVTRDEPFGLGDCYAETLVARQSVADLSDFRISQMAKNREMRAATGAHDLLNEVIDGAAYLFPALRSVGNILQRHALFNEGVSQFEIRLIRGLLEELFGLFGFLGLLLEELFELFGFLGLLLEESLGFQGLLH